MKKRIITAMVILLVAGCVPTTQQVNTLTNDVDRLMVKIDNYQDKSSEEVDRIQERIVKVNDAVKEKADESALEQIRAGWEETKDYNPYYGYGALALTILGEAGALWKLSKKSTNLEKGINRVKGEATPELAKTIHDTIKVYTG